MGFHLRVAATTGVNNAVLNNHVQAIPNPASNSTAISFNLDAAANVTVTLTDVTGYVVASETMCNVAQGKVGINTANIPSGVYMYTVSANGKRTTGRVTIAH